MINISDINMNMNIVNVKKNIDYGINIEREIDDLFDTLLSIFTANQNMDSLKTVKIKAIWALSLIAHCNKYDFVIDLRNGIANACKEQSPFFPTVGKFISWCDEYATDKEASEAHFDFTRRISRMDFLYIETVKKVGSECRRYNEFRAKDLFVRTYKNIAFINKISVNLIDYDKSKKMKLANNIINEKKLISVRYERKSKVVGAPQSILKMLGINN